jgi:hypothetical protein
MVWASMSTLVTFNVEAGLPVLEEARRQVIAEIHRARRSGARVLKIIHGYGSSGKGGTLCHGLRKSFTLRKKEGVIKDFIPGEDLSIFNPKTLSLLEAVPELRGDPDLDATNEGVTVLWLK